ncbi:MAG: tyrosine-protein phosphatase [bacterium]|nr:tyrosine-protein phosphatase [bacterium]
MDVSDSGRRGSDRRLHRTGLRNLRDPGGYPAGIGWAIRWRQVYRSGTLSDMAECDGNQSNDGPDGREQVVLAKQTAAPRVGGDLTYTTVGGRSARREPVRHTRPRYSRLDYCPSRCRWRMERDRVASNTEPHHRRLRPCSARRHSRDRRITDDRRRRRVEDSPPELHHQLKAPAADRQKPGTDAVPSLAWVIAHGRLGLEVAFQCR